MSHYADYHVMDQQEHWDDNTRRIVASRLELGPDSSYDFFTHEESAKMSAIGKLLIGDDRQEIMEFVLRHMDKTLHSSIGEGQRKLGVPKDSELVRSGLSSLEQAAQERYSRTFVELQREEQQQLLTELSEQRADPPHVWQSIPQKPLFTKWLNLTVEAYYSHPVVWSEIGYGGPAYPRGYVRTQLGQLDPWEAHPTTQAKSDA